MALDFHFDRANDGGRIRVMPDFILSITKLKIVLAVFVLPAAFAGCSMSMAAETGMDGPWQPLCNGQDLSGWQPVNGGVYTVTNGVLQLSGGNGWLRTEREFGDFILEGEGRGRATNFNSGIFLRAPLEGKPWATNVWQINLKQSAIGELLQGSRKVVTNTVPPVAAGEWVKFSIRARGTNLTLKVNGKSAWEFCPLEPARGHIGLQAEGKEMEFRNLRVREPAAGQE